MHVLNYNGLDETKPVFGVSDKPRLKSVSSAIEKSRKIERSRYGTLQKVNNKGTEQPVQMHRLVRVFVVHKPPKISVLASRPKDDLFKLVK